MIDPELVDEDAPSVTVRALRQFAAVWLLLFAAIAGWHLRGGDTIGASAWAALALAMGPLGLVRPSAIEPLFLLLVTLTRPIGLAVSRLVLAVLFYGLFTPVSLLFRSTGRDALNRARRSEPETYWRARATRSDARRYFQQY